MKTFAERLSLFAFKFDQPMRDAIFIEEIIELMSFAHRRLARTRMPGKFAIAARAVAVA